MAHGPTHASLNSFHAIGQSKSSSSGIGGIEYLIYCKKHRENEICTVHYRDKTLTYAQVLDTKKDIVGCVMTDFIEDYLYTNTGQNYVKHYTIDTYASLTKRWWHFNTYYINNVINGVVPPDDAYVLRLHLDLTQMYRFKVTIQDLVDAFQREYESPIHLLYGPMQDAILDIYACADYHEKKNGDQVLEAVDCEEGQKNMISTSYYETIIMPSLTTLRIKGVAGMSDLTPIVTPVISVILKDDDVAWLLTLAQPQNASLSNIDNLLKLFNLVNIMVKYQTDNTLLL